MKLFEPWLRCTNNPARSLSLAAHHPALTSLVVVLDTVQVMADSERNAAHGRRGPRAARKLLT